MASLELTIMEAVKMMNAHSMQILLVVDENRRLQGVVTDGDIRRALEQDIDFSDPISGIMSTSPITIQSPPDKKKVLELMKTRDVRHIPVVDEDGRAVSLLLWKDFFKNGDVAVEKKPNTVVIMAGGKGTRLDIFTKILPKPLIPIGEKPIIGHIMDNFSNYGFRRFLISLNYKAEMIKMYFSDNHIDYEIGYIQEPDYMGTAGALALGKDQLTDTCLVSNCDVIIDTNLDCLFGYHKDQGNHATILSTVQNFKIPFGVLKTDNANLVEIIEKPEYNFVINSGIYVLEPEVLDLIPATGVTDMPNLLLDAKNKGLKVQIYPMTCSWFDVGEWGEYKRAVDHMSRLGTDHSAADIIG